MLPGLIRVPRIKDSSVSVVEHMKHVDHHYLQSQKALVQTQHDSNSDTIAIMTGITLPQHQTAVVGLANGQLGISNDAPVPEFEDDMIIVSTTAVALNPVDVKMQGRLATAGAIAGHDFAGRVLAIGPKARTTVPLSPGDRVCSAVQGMHSLTPAVGSFAQIVGASAHACLRVPDYMSDEEAATLGTAVATIGIALFRSLEIPGHPDSPVFEGKGRYILIYGASSSTGTIAVQLAKL